MRICFIRLLWLAGLLLLPLRSLSQIEIPDDFVLSMQRGNCEGGCPVYRVILFSNGDVVWQGRGRVAKLGVALGHINGDAIREIIHQIQDIDLFEIDNSYGFRGVGCTSMSPDMPMVIITVSMNGSSKILSHHDGCNGEVSEKLSRLETAIDAAAETSRWISGALGTRGHKAK